MRVAIIGAGNVGKALGTSLSRAGHEVTITAKHRQHAEEAAREIGVAPKPTPAEAVERAELVVLAVPFGGAADDVTDEIRGKVAGKTLVDVTNPLKPDYSGLATEGTSAAEEIQKRLPEAKVVKAFNTVFAANQANPKPEIDVFVAGNDPEAKEKVMQLAKSAGFSPLDVGPLPTARYLEGMAYINIGLNAQNGWSWTSTWKLER